MNEVLTGSIIHMNTNSKNGTLRKSLLQKRYNNNKNFNGVSYFISFFYQDIMYINRYNYVAHLTDRQLFLYLMVEILMRYYVKNIYIVFEIRTLKDIGA